MVYVKPFIFVFLKWKNKYCTFFAFTTVTLQRHRKIYMIRKPVFIVLLVLEILLGLPLQAQVTDTTRVVTDSLSQPIDTVQDQSLTPVIKRKGQQKGISGIVIDKDTRDPVSFVPVFVPESPIGTITEADGTFVLDVSGRPNDTLRVKTMGYEQYSVLITKESGSIDTIELETNATSLSELVVRPGEDPAIRLLKNIIRNKPKNDPEQVDNYGYEAYNKIEVDILNLSKKSFESLPVPFLKKLSFIYDNQDTTKDGRPYLPFFLTEAISDYYYQKKPYKTREYVKASQIKGINNKNMTQSIGKYLGKMYLAMNPYDNYVPFFNKRYVSPINNTGPLFYKYRIIDTQQKYGYNIITVSFIPLPSCENCFAGVFNVVDSVYALQYVAATLPSSANINWVKNAEFYREYAPQGDSLWFCVKENITAELQAADELVKMVGFIARKTTSYKDIVINDSSVTKAINSPKLKAEVVVADSSYEHGQDFWANARHDTLSGKETGIYYMYDSLENNPSFKKFKTMAKILFSGGYKWGPLEFGPYWNMYSRNFVEGNRFRFSLGTTPKLFKTIYLNGYVAYGTLDDRYKYQLQGFWLMKRYPRMYINASYTRDIDRTVNYYDKVSFDNIFSVAARKSGIPQKLVFADDIRFEYYNEYYSGFSHLLTLYRKIYDPYDPLPDQAIFQDQNGNQSPTLTNTEVNLRLRYAYKEKFLEANYYRTSLGSKYPIVELRYGIGMKGVLNGGYNYHKLNFTVSDNIRIPPLGTIYMNLFAGKYFGTLPYPLLEQHPGNEFYTYNKYAFNMMNQYEFISDQYVGLNVEHLIGGGIFKYIPYIKKFKFRQFWTAKGLIGSLSDENKALNFNKGFMFRSLNNSPYVEVGTGVENIFKLFRVDFVWRLTPSSLPNEQVQRNFGIFGSIKLTF